ncbi:protein kinase domain-containing protein [Streptomyces sp. BE133]|uniref:serine/threonine-protein kinase n=1 Tax=Streptomyces sp. BE133 TaxID=3002523 RepID=UPI002E78BF12|nr:PQQ-binding-like beta-propeller repeat protein [Streptomyces sp. BE133]MEE1809589.1 PQQ-binding-like beta-propeller repeat protein [Streptomyces sp. BE133]
MLEPLLHDDPPSVGSYRLVARLGSGGMGTVYLARSPGGRTVALKTVHARIAADATFRTRFRLEADAARVIGGQHGAQVFDADPLAETPWLATEYVLGPPLDEAVSRCGPLPETAVRAVGAALCGALGQLHSSEVVHRDLKPSNVMLSAYGPKVIDFGIARALGDDRLTRTGTAAGTPAYMSPEQASGQEQTPAGDVFALAGVLVFAATGHGPFGGGQAADLIYRVRYADPDLTGVPPSLAPLLARCLAKDPALRPSTAQLVAELHDGHGEFADHLPAEVLTEIARLAAEVWQYRTHRLPASPEQAGTLPKPSAPRRAGMSRRRLLGVAGLSAAAVGAGVWAGVEFLSTNKSDASASRGQAGPGKQDLLQILWTNDTARPQDYGTPFFVGDTPVVMDINHLVGLDPATGKDNWRSMSLSPLSQAISDGSRIYCLLLDSKERLSLLSLGKTGGADRTIVALPDVKALGSSNTVAALLHASNGTVYLAAGRKAKLHTKDWHLLAVDTASGKVRWQTPFNETEDPSFENGLWFAKTVGDVLVLGGEFDQLKLHAYDNRSGKHFWSSEVSDWMDETTSPVTTGAELADDGQHIYVGAGLVQAIRVSDGTVIWEFGNFRDFGDASPLATHYGAPAIRKGVVYAAERTGAIVAIDTRRGELLWETPAPEENAPLLAAPPVLSATHLYYVGKAGLGAIDLRTHKYVRTQAASLQRLAADPDNRVIIGVGNERVTALRME